MNEAQRRHNVLAPEIVERIVRGVDGDFPQAMVVLESVVLGVLLYGALHVRTQDLRVRHSIEFLDSMSDAVVARLRQGEPQGGP